MDSLFDILSGEEGNISKNILLKYRSEEQIVFEVVPFSMALDIVEDEESYVSGVKTILLSRADDIREYTGSLGKLIVEFAGNEANTFEIEAED